MAWSHRRIEVERQHDARLVAALYNQTFSVVGWAGRMAVLVLPIPRPEGRSTQGRDGIGWHLPGVPLSDFMSGVQEHTLPGHRVRQAASAAPPLFILSHAQVVSGDEGGTICMWNVQSGQREGSFSLHSKPAASAGGGAPSMRAPAPPKLTAMAFDSHQRRLLTALDRGAVRLYNFNSGAVLREFASRAAQQELTAVAFVPRVEPSAEGEQQEESREAGADDNAASQDCPTAGPQPGAQDSDLSERTLMLRQQQDLQALQQEGLLTPRGTQRSVQPGGSSAGSPASASAASGSTTGSNGANLVLATGWGRSLCVWEEGEEAQGSRCRLLKGHSSDVLCMAPLGRDIVATGEDSKHIATLCGRGLVGRRPEQADSPGP